MILPHGAAIAADGHGKLAVVRGVERVLPVAGRPQEETERTPFCRLRLNPTPIISMFLAPYAVIPVSESLMPGASQRRLMYGR